MSLFTYLSLCYYWVRKCFLFSAGRVASTVRFWLRTLGASPLQFELHFVNQNSSCCTVFHYFSCVFVIKIISSLYFYDINNITSVCRKDIFLLSTLSHKGHSRIYTNSEQGDWDYKGIVHLFLITHELVPNRN